MSYAARIQEGVVVEVTQLPADLPLADAFHPDAGFVVAAANTAVGMLYDGAFHPAPEPEPPREAEIKAALFAHAAAARFVKETGGIEFAGATIATDRQSQALISGAFALVQQQPETTIRFKTAAGFVALDAEQMTAIAIAVGQHVQACFALEADVAGDIEAGGITTTGEIDAAFV